MGVLMREAEELTVRGLKAVRVKKDVLLHKIEANRERHVTDFRDAMEGWKKLRLETLTRALKNVQNGDQPDADKDLPAGEEQSFVSWGSPPTDHTRDYDRVISMLNMSLDDELDIPAHEFARYALDEWDWSGGFNAAKAAYTAVGRARQ